MKASLKFREEKNPLLRAKLPFTAGALPLSSGFAVGNSQELAIHVGTFFAAGPAVKLAFKPNDPSPFSVVLKAGLGRWGSPNGAPITLKAEFYVAPKLGDPIFTLRVKPRVGDFSFQKDVHGVGYVRTQQKQSSPAPSQEKPAITTPPPAGGDLKVTPKRNSGNFSGNLIDKDRMRSPSIDSNAVVIGSNFSLRIEGLDRDWKGRNDKKPKAEGAKEQDGEGEFTTMFGNGDGMHVPSNNEVANELTKSGEGRMPSKALSLARAHNGLKGCRIITHSSFPLGKQARLNVRWGVNPPLDFLQGWDGSLPSLHLSKLPLLLLNKISFEQASLPAGKKNAAALQRDQLEGGYLPASFLEENRELAQVASLCYNMKQQLHLLYVENQVLKRSMEDMKSQVDLRGLRSIPTGAEDSVFSKEQVFSRAIPNLDSPHALHKSIEEGRWDVEARTGHKNMRRKDGDTDVRPLVPSALGVADANTTMEFEKVIKGAMNRPTGGKRD